MSLHNALVEVGSAPHLLLAVDFDGTLAPLVDDPDASRGDPMAMAILTDLASRPGVEVAIVSGRTHADLVRLTGMEPPVRLIGEHGNDTGGGGDVEDDVLAGVESRFSEAAEGLPGAFVERKRRTVAFHHRRADHEAGEDVATELAAWAEGLGGVTVTVGKKVVEAGIGSVHKGDAVEALRAGLPDGPVVFLGDDTTDEHAFRVLREGDVGVKVGPGPTAAGHRVAGVEDVVVALGTIAAAVARR